MKKTIIAVVLVMLAIIAGYTLLSTPEEIKTVEEKKPFSFQFSPQDYGMLDNGEHVRGYLTAHIIADSVGNSTVDMIMLGKPVKNDIYEVIDYPYAEDKHKALDSMESGLSQYGLEASGFYLEDVLGRKGVVVILPSDAMPDVLSSGKLTELIDGNVVIYFGKPLDISMDISGSQDNVGEAAYDALGVTSRNGVLSAKPNGPHVEQAGEAMVLEYPNGWLVLYLSEGGEEEQLGQDLSQLILREGWQSDRVEDSFTAPEGRGAVSFFSSPAEPGSYQMRVLFNATEEGGPGQRIGMFDMDEVRKPSGLLILDETRGADGKIDYSFELHSNETYPINYDFRLQFIRNGTVAVTETAKTVTMKTYSEESGQVSPELAPGEYVVRLIDQQGTVHAAGYTRVPKVRVKLESITESTHTFLITIDDKPAESVPIVLDINSKENFTLKTDKEGHASAEFAFAPGTHTFTVYAGGESGATRYVKKDDSSNTMLYGGLLFAAVFLGVVMVFGARKKRKWAIKTYHRPSTPSKVLDMPYDTFLELFGMSQKDRAKDLPLTISDLRIGLRKHATYKGAPLFVTDSNLYTLLDGMVKKGTFLSYGGYFLPAGMAGGKPIEYWVLKRRLSDHFIEKGEEPESAPGADFMVAGKLVHIWHEPDPKKLLSLCRKTDNVVIFPNEKEKDRFIAMMHGYDPAWMKLSLELQYGRLYCQTLDEFLERGLHAES